MFRQFLMLLLTLTIFGLPLAAKDLVSAPIVCACSIDHHQAPALATDLAPKPEFAEFAGLNSYLRRVASLNNGLQPSARANIGLQPSANLNGRMLSLHSPASLNGGLHSPANLNGRMLSLHSPARANGRMLSLHSPARANGRMLSLHSPANLNGRMLSLHSPARANIGLQAPANLNGRMLSLQPSASPNIGLQPSARVNIGLQPSASPCKAITERPMGSLRCGDMSDQDLVLQASQCITKAGDRYCVDTATEDVSRGRTLKAKTRSKLFQIALNGARRQAIEAVVEQRPDLFRSLN